jgi:hypothetical protein
MRILIPWQDGVGNAGIYAQRASFPFPTTLHTHLIHHKQNISKADHPTPDSGALERSFSVLIDFHRMSYPWLWTQYCASSFWKPFGLHGAAEMKQRSGGVIKMRLGTAK